MIIFWIFFFIHVEIFFRSIFLLHLENSIFNALGFFPLFLHFSLIPFCFCFFNFWIALIICEIKWISVYIARLAILNHCIIILIVTEKSCYCSLLFHMNILHIYISYMDQFGLAVHVRVRVLLMKCTSKITALFFFFSKNIMVSYCWHLRCLGYLLSCLVTQYMVW